MITDELRKVAAKTECANGRCEKLYRGDLDHIADRIDELVGREYIELPKDADGETIRIGDELEFCNGGKVRRGKVQAISDCWVFFGEGPFYGVKSCRHTKPDTWERIIEDAQADGVRYHNDGKPSDFDALVERCKKLAGDAE